MRKCLIGGVAAALVAATAQATPAYAADVGTYDTSVNGYGTVSVGAAGNAIAVAGNPTYEIRFRYRHVNGRWSQDYRLPGGLAALGHAASSIAAVGRGGSAVVLGATSSSVSQWRLAATLRRADATWTAPYVLSSGLPGRATGVDVAANADGDYAVSWTQLHAADDYRTYVAVRLRGGSWQRFLMGATSVGPTQVGIDAAGNATVARTVRSSEAGPARLVARRKPVGGPVDAAFQVSLDGDDVGSFDQVVERTGRRTYAYQVAHEWNAPFTTSRVLRQQTVGGPLGQVWSSDDSLLPSIAADGGRLRVVWIEQPVPAEPRTVMTQAFNPAAGAPVEISDAPVEPRLTGVAIDRYGVGVLVVGTDFGSHDEPVPITRAHHVTEGGVGAGDWIDQQNRHWDNHMVAAHPVLGPGKEYFIGVDSWWELPAGDDGELLVYRGELP